MYSWKARQTDKLKFSKMLKRVSPKSFQNLILFPRVWFISLRAGEKPLENLSTHQKENMKINKIVTRSTTRTNKNSKENEMKKMKKNNINTTWTTTHLFYYSTEKRKDFFLYS